MPSSLAGLRYPCARVLLPRTRLAYIHLRNLLTDAKRDRAARVSGYVAIWLPEELVVLYLLGGEVVNATIRDREAWRAATVADALALVPHEPEYGEICFHEAEETQLACMFTAQTAPPEPWPAGLVVSDPAVLFPYLMATTFDGMLEIVADETVNYLVLRNGSVERAFLVTTTQGTLVDRLGKLFPREPRGHARIRQWRAVSPLVEQAPTALIDAYRELTHALVARLVEQGRESAPAIAEQARTNLVETHPALAGFSFNGGHPAEPVMETAALTTAVAAWMKDVIWAAADHDVMPPEQLLKELTWERRHMFLSAGLYDLLPWRVV